MNLIELAQQAGLNPKWVASTAGGEYHSSCPRCGGKDRFYVQPNRQMSNCIGFYSCRQCGSTGDAIEFARQFLNYTFQEAVQTLNATISERPPSQLIYKSCTTRPVTLKQPCTQWVEKATNFTNQAHKNLLDRDDVLAYLSKRGLPLDAILRYKIGWITDNKFFPRTSWGLDQLSQNSKSHLWLPRGLLIPSIESSGQVMRLKIRRYDWKDGDELPKYIAISGSMNGLTIVGSSKQLIVVVVESELDAYAINHAVGDFVCTVGVGSNIKNPDNVTDRLAINAKLLLICHDNDHAGKKMLDKWCKLYPHAEGSPTPIGKDIGEAIEQGLDIRQWISKYQL